MTDIPLIWMPVIVAAVVALLGVIVGFIATRDRGRPKRLNHDGKTKPQATPRTLP